MFFSNHEKTSTDFELHMSSIHRGTPKDKVYQRDLLVSEDSLIQHKSAQRNVRGHQG